MAPPGNRQAIDPVTPRLYAEGNMGAGHLEAVAT